jgi:hypothetical protein
MVNYLRWFIVNLAGKVDSLLPLVRLKHEDHFVWGEEQRDAFERIKTYLISPPVLKVPKIGEDFKVYIAAHESIVGGC